ncbi:hypothetical protein D3C72_1746250 [compost metagenome]
MITAPPITTTPQNLASIASISAQATTAAPTMPILTKLGNLALKTPNAAAPTTHRISAYIISLVMARSIE